MAVLSISQINLFYQKYWDITTYIKGINENQPDKQFFKNIQIPVSLTQSLAFHIISKNPSLIFLDEIIIRSMRMGNNNTFDLIYEQDNKIINIEVKATGTNNFQRLRKKALLADFVIWLNFHSYNKYDIAVFKPTLINPKGKSELEILWNKLIKINGVNYIPNNTL